ncbi:hypothetical protein ACHAWF_005887 [Thalassiosira exigua]
MTDQDGGIVILRSIYASSIEASLPDDKEEWGGASSDGNGDGRSDLRRAGVEVGVDDDAEDATERSATTATLPPSTHTLFFTQPVLSLPFLFATGIVGLSYMCLWLVAFNNVFGRFHDPSNPFDVPANVTLPVRAAQYLAIFVALLMEEEIPTGLTMLRKFNKASFRRSFPDKNYGTFVASSILRIWMGYFFLFNVFIVLAQADGVIEIFYDVLALQFVQQLDDIAFSLCKMDVFGKRMLRACTARCFETEFGKIKSRRTRRINIFLKTVYFANLGLLLLGMISISINQMRGSYQCDSITVNFGGDVWEDAIVSMPKEQYDKWVTLYPYFRDRVTPDRYSEWTLVFSYFNGFYEKDGTHAGRPIYRERRKSDRTPYGEGLPHAFVLPSVIKYCDGISAWIFTHDHIQKSEEKDEVTCVSISFSEKCMADILCSLHSTFQFSLGAIGCSDQKVYGVIGETDVSYSCNGCVDNAECNMNGQCIDGQCKCNKKNDAHFLGTHCEIKIKSSCRTIIGGESKICCNPIAYYSQNALTFSGSEADTNNPGFVSYYVNGKTSIPGKGSHYALYQQYSRPVYTFGSWENNVELIYSGDRWFGQLYNMTALNMTINDKIIASNEYHAFWGRGYDQLLTQFVSAPTKKNSPVGVDFFKIDERGEQFGPFGSLIPVQKNNQTGRGFFRCESNIASYFDGTNSTLEPCCKPSEYYEY